MPYRLDVVDAVARAPTRLVRESRPFHDGVVPTQITDVADAMVARQLFDACWDAGLVLVATSNRPPEALYEGGPNRQYFSPFVTRRARGVRRYPYAIEAPRLRERRAVRTRGSAQAAGAVPRRLSRRRE